jgi:phosphoglycolate phosphatase-like HAD superfamily hydrolase
MEKKIFIFDLDGTLADVSTRKRKALANGPFDWDVWQNKRLILMDTPNTEVVAKCRELYNQGHEIHIFSARTMKNYGVTLRWLEFYDIPYHDIHLRPLGDFRKDSEFKSKLIDEVLKDRHHLVDTIFDDRNQVVDMWRARGFNCHQVINRENGDF